MDLMAQAERENHDTNWQFSSHGAAKLGSRESLEMIDDTKFGHEGSGAKVYMSVFSLSVSISNHSAEYWSLKKIMQQ